MTPLGSPCPTCGQALAALQVARSVDTAPDVAYAIVEPVPLVVCANGHRYPAGA